MSYLIINAILFGIALSLTLTVIMGISFQAAPDVWLRSYPSEIKARFGAMTDKAKHLRPYLSIVYFGAIVIVAASSLNRLQAHLGGEARLLEYALSLFISLMTFNLYDLLILDWLFFVTLKLRFFILPGTEGMPAYDDYAFHARAFLRGTLICAAGAIILAGLAAAILAPLVRL
ncbi:MAG: hypothetical protein JXA97_11170 [Anaerolineales bacterium]|nr:hypothetical protein [Anaerolineales bacterium]